QEKRILQQQAESEGKPPEIARRIVEGRLEKFYSQVCLLDQAYIRDADLTVGELLKEAMASLGENIQVRRFARFAVGQD
ncbi:MAG: elongation factor Ts, partial [Bacillota bacterium]